MEDLTQIHYTYSEVNSGLLSGTFSLNNFGDQLIAYVGTESSPIFIAATNYSRANVKWILIGAIDEYFLFPWNIFKLNIYQRIKFLF